jgi:mannose-6-phosphate isomerase-like protein (cupin superfamily)
MRHALPFAVLLGSLAAVGASAQEAAPKLSYVSIDQLQHILQVAPSTNGAPADFSAKIFNAKTSSTAFIRLSAPDLPHVHGQQDEVFLVTEGGGVLETGGTITGEAGSSGVHSLALDVTGKPLPKRAPPTGPAKPAAPVDPFDRSGAAIEGGSQQVVKAGDILLIPAHLPHHWLKVDKQVVYFDLKFAKAP